MTRLLVRSRFITAAVVVFMSVGLALMACCKSQSPAPERQPRAKNLSILTPHNANTREAFESGFSGWYRKKYNEEVNVDWIANGTPQCVRYVESFMTLPSERGPRRRPDVLFGGGVVDHRLLATNDRTMTLSLGDQIAALPKEINGIPTRDEDGKWYATGLSSFGLLINDRACEERGINPPATWADMAAPQYYSWLGIGDPATSGSNRQCLVLILQKHGWDEGWSIITRILGNCRALANRSSVALDQVRSGMTLACFSVNFDGLSRVEKSSGVLRYVNPLEGTAYTPSIVSVLKCTDDEVLAKRFVEYVLSEEGQVLWGVREGDDRRLFVPTLYHYPIKPDVYKKYADTLALEENPLSVEGGLTIDLESSRKQSIAIAPLIHAACGRNHSLLQRAWKAVIDAGMPEDALAELTSPPFSAEEAYENGKRFAEADQLEATDMMAEWSEKFRVKYEGVLAKLGS